MKKLELFPAYESLGFQIAPMIDVVFVVMLFFMIMAGGIKAERELTSQLPAKETKTTSIDAYDIQTAKVSAQGDISVGDTVCYSEGEIHSAIKALKDTSAKTKKQLSITVVSDPDARYSKTIDILSALSAEGVTNVTFTATEESK